MRNEIAIMRFQVSGFRCQGKKNEGVIYYWLQMSSQSLAAELKSLIKKLKNSVF
jgi:alanine-alpha-ketoisovalerate/valine-pyruvate aminotransferase